VSERTCVSVAVSARRDSTSERVGSDKRACLLLVCRWERASEGAAKKSAARKSERRRILLARVDIESVFERVWECEKG